ncbi:Ig-like domain-containing protein [Vibrio rhodolitus]|uniref:Ig-like domain-containing protein n=1 Tax=Vibrio rhodolitus TaxID=2231649 RepID=UPI000E0BF6B4|nr:Ig-like domain-containing protein [Vibrio rhodolitus]
MKIKFPKWLAVITFPSLLLLAGCNSEGAFNSSESAFDTSEGVLFDIEVTPNDGFVLMKHGSLQLKATGKYDDGTELDISDSVEWTVVYDTATSKVSSTGLVEGETEGEVIITASKSGIVSDDATVTITSLAGPVIDIFDTGSGKLFTSSPSVPYLDSIGGSDFESFLRIREDSDYGFAGDYYTFYLTYANTLCAKYNTLSIGGRTNWRLATLDELQVELYGAFGDMFAKRGWAVNQYFMTATPSGNGSSHYGIMLTNGDFRSVSQNYPSLATCVSNP